MIPVMDQSSFVLLSCDTANVSHRLKHLGEARRLQIEQASLQSWRHRLCS